MSLPEFVKGVYQISSQWNLTLEYKDLVFRNSSFKSGNTLEGTY